MSLLKIEDFDCIHLDDNGVACLQQTLNFINKLPVTSKLQRMKILHEVINAEKKKVSDKIEDITDEKESKEEYKEVEENESKTR